MPRVSRLALACVTVAVGLFTLAAARWAPRSAAQDAPESSPLTAARAEALAHISASSLAGHVSFLASDLLEGRDTPSIGLDIAAEYIAAQFRRAGLEPAGDDGYFQTARWTYTASDPASFRCEIRVGDEVFHLGLDQVTLIERGAISLENVPVARLSATDEASLQALAAETVAGRAVVCDLPTPPAPEEGARPGRLSVARLQSPIVNRLKELGAAAVIWLDGSSTRGSGLPGGRLIDPDSRGATAPRTGSAAARPISLTIHDRAAREALANAENATLSLSVAAPSSRPVALRNVAGLLRGSDPELRDTYIIVSAHYDHVGVGGQPGQADRIFNGANDDASGTAMVMEVAEALARLKPAPKRSILFLALFGEEKGLLGSRFYGRHPIFPLERTVAMVNLEHMGRTDDTEGPQIRRASMTGFDYSDVGPVFASAGSAVGVEIFKHPSNSDSFFGRSDNQALADQGIPSHTLCATFIFPDYHAVGDHWDKIDYANMAELGRAVGLGLLMLADQEQPPRWNEGNTRAARYLKAHEALHTPRAED